MGDNKSIRNILLPSLSEELHRKNIGERLDSTRREKADQWRTDSPVWQIPESTLQIPAEESRKDETIDEYLTALRTVAWTAISERP